MISRFPSLARLTLVAAGLVAGGTALANPVIERALLAQLATAKANQPMVVVITFKQSGPIKTTQVAALEALGIKRGVTMRSLPIMGAVVTPEIVKALARRSDVYSISTNKPLKYFNNEANQQSGSRLVNTSHRDFGVSTPFSGFGVTVMVNDSGIDTTNPDLPLGTKVVDNVQAAQNIALNLASDLAGPGILPIVHLKNQINTDLGSGHGTHVAGTVGGIGQQSARGKNRGAAPGASLLGYGSGGVLLILDAVGGLDYALTHQFTYRNPIMVTSNSWGTSGEVECEHPVNVATYELAKKGILSVFAAGNDGPGEDTHNPYAQAPWVVSVGASEKDGVLTGFSSRGKRGGKKDCTMPDGQTFTFVNEPTIVAAGVNIISTRALTGALPALEAQADAQGMPANEVPYYTFSSGTSMATPHVSGVVALMQEAAIKSSPNRDSLTPAQVKSILQQTATNMTGRDRFEVGAGHLNAYAAVAQAQAVAKGGATIAYGSTIKTARTFFANQVLVPGATTTETVAFSPIGANPGKTFTVAADVVEVTARMTSGANPVGVQLISPSGKVYGSSIALPVLGDTVAASGPGEAGTWTVKIKGLGSLSGVALDPLRLTNGYGLPESFPVQVSQLRSGGFTGMSDIPNHPARNAIEYAVGKRLVDGHSTGRFNPDALLKRGEFAQYLVLAGSLRQSIPFGPNGRSTSGLPSNDALYATAEIVTAKGSVLRDLTYSQAPVLPLQNGSFNAMGNVSRYDLAYSLVQSLALEPTVTGLAKDVAFKAVTFQHDGKSIPVEDVGNLTKQAQAYVQIAINAGLLRPTLFLKDSTTFGGLPTLAARFEPNKAITRAEYALSAGQFQVMYQSGEDGK